jgi:hypothetical protein
LGLDTSEVLQGRGCLGGHPRWWWSGDPGPRLTVWLVQWWSSLVSGGLGASTSGRVSRGARWRWSRWLSLGGVAPPLVPPPLCPVEVVFFLFE